ncbi:ABC transporter substrate-binding protein [Spirillospora sp. NPDC048911]|uniref:ABC transporter substrate-binding protein n=1 Tax=Spirillospora sp. NPDC048911 TaxID=3364527 RepID=UPI003724A2D0
MRFRSPSALLLCVLLLVSLASACGDSGDGGGAGSRDKTKIKVATLPLVVDAPFYIALRHKLFEKEGLQVTPVLVPQSKQAVPGLVRGDIDIVYGNDASFLQGHDSGTLKVRLVAEGTTLSPGFMAVLVMPGSPVRTIADLGGKSVSVHILNNVQALTFNAIVKAGKGDPKRIRYREVLLPNMAAALQKGDIDAMHGMEPFISDAKRKLGARVVSDGAAAPVRDIALDGYFTTDRWAGRNPGTARAFQRAMIKANALAADRREVEAVLPSYTRVDPAIAKIMTMPGYPASISAARIQRLIDLMVGQGQLRKRLDAASIVVAGS